ncbi:MAG: hypothetical protein U5Q03_16090 [Bacteroidota bacterium]|nr:hypothetical protein [Bacteroidota bacterium]
MEDLIYILIGVAWIAFSIYGQQKKLKEKQRKAAQRRAESRESSEDYYHEPEKEEQNSGSFLNNIMNEFELKEEKPEYETIYHRRLREEKEREIEAEKARRAAHDQPTIESVESIGGGVEGNSSLSKDYFESRDKKYKIRKNIQSKDTQEVIEVGDEIGVNMAVRSA